MKKSFASLLISASLFFSPLSFAQVQTTDISYTYDGTKMKGYIAYDDNIKGKRPAVLVVHEWWGHNDFARKKAEMLAKAGYTAMAIDMYGDGKKAEHPKDAKAFATAIFKNMDTAEARFTAAMDILKKHDTVTADSISAIGYCFGGGIVLNMIRRGVDLDVAASFHGSLKTPMPAEEESLKGMDVLVFNGAADPMVKKEDVTAIVNEMSDAKTSFTLVNYPDVLHAFTNPDADKFATKFKMPLKYDKEADEHSWAVLLETLNQKYN